MLTTVQRWGEGKGPGKVRNRDSRAARQEELGPYSRAQSARSAIATTSTKERIAQFATFVTFERTTSTKQKRKSNEEEERLNYPEQQQVLAEEKENDKDNEELKRMIKRTKKFDENALNEWRASYRKAIENFTFDITVPETECEIELRANEEKHDSYVTQMPRGMETTARKDEKKMEQKNLFERAKPNEPGELTRNNQKLSLKHFEKQNESDKMTQGEREDEKFKQQNFRERNAEYAFKEKSKETANLEPNINKKQDFKPTILEKQNFKKKILDKPNFKPKIPTPPRQTRARTTPTLFHRRVRIQHRRARLRRLHRYQRARVPAPSAPAPGAASCPRRQGREARR